MFGSASLTDSVRRFSSCSFFSLSTNRLENKKNDNKKRDRKIRLYNRPHFQSVYCSWSKKLTLRIKSKLYDHCISPAFAFMTIDDFTMDQNNYIDIFPVFTLFPQFFLGTKHRLRTKAFTFCFFVRSYI